MIEISSTDLLQDQDFCRELFLKLYTNLDVSLINFFQAMMLKNENEKLEKTFIYLFKQEMWYLIQKLSTEKGITITDLNYDDEEI